MSATTPTLSRRAWLRATESFAPGILAREVVPPSGGEQQRHRQPVDRRAGGRFVAAEQDLSQQAADGTGARLARGVHPAATPLQVALEQAELRRGARAVDPFEHDEEGWGHERS